MILFSMVENSDIPFTIWRNYADWHIQVPNNMSWKKHVIEEAEWIAAQCRIKKIGEYRTIRFGIPAHKGRWPRVYKKGLVLGRY